MSVNAIEWFDQEENHIELAEDHKSFHYSLLLPNDNNQVETYSGEIVFTTEERYGLIMRQFLEDVLLGENTDVFKGYMARRILGGHNNNQTAYELFNKERREDFVETLNLLDKEQLHDLFIRFGGENAEEFFNNFIKLSDGKRHVDAELKQWLKENLPNLFKATDTMAWVARWELLNATLVLGRFTDDPTQMPIVTHGDYRITPEWYCYYVAIRRIFDSQYHLWKAQSAAGRIQFQHFVREKYEPSFGRGVVFYSYDILTSILYSIVFDFLIDNSVSMSLRLGVSDYLKKAGADCPDFLQYLDHKFEPYRNTAGSSMSFSLPAQTLPKQEQEKSKYQERNDVPGLHWPTDEELEGYENNYNSSEYFKDSMFGTAPNIKASDVEKLYACLTHSKLKVLEDNLETKLILLSRYTGKVIPHLEVKPLEWKVINGEDSDKALGYLIKKTANAHFAKGIKFFYYLDRNGEKAQFERIPVSEGGNAWALSGRMETTRRPFEKALNIFINEYQRQDNE